jgi:hypothetical protein
MNHHNSLPLFPEEVGASGAPAGVEFEATHKITEPFDPASISIDSRVVPMDTLLRRLRQGSIKLAPTFQRNYVWDSIRQSRLIESLMLRIPLPMFYVASNSDGTWDVVDGLQRLTTIRNFILGDDKGASGITSFPLIELEFWGDHFNNRYFKDIEGDPANSKIINNILETEMRFTVINPGTPEEVKRNIFKRINTGGMPLTLQEIRHALYQGEATRLLQDLVDSPSFQRAIDHSIDDSRMAGRELALRFLAFHIIGPTHFNGDMDTFLSNAMRVINLMQDISSKDLIHIFKENPVPTLLPDNPDRLRHLFFLSMNRCLEFFGGHAFRKGTSGQRRTPVNKALFEVWSTTFAALDEPQYQKLLSCRKRLLDDYKLILDSDDFDRAISRDSSSSLGVRDRYAKIKELVNQYLT